MAPSNIRHRQFLDILSISRHHPQFRQQSFFLEGPFLVRIHSTKKKKVKTAEAVGCLKQTSFQKMRPLNGLALNHCELLEAELVPKFNGPFQKAGTRPPGFKSVRGLGRRGLSLGPVGFSPMKRRLVAAGTEPVPNPPFRKCSSTPCQSQHQFGLLEEGLWPRAERACGRVCGLGRRGLR